MTIEFHCPHCDKLLRTSDEKAGRQATCPGCSRLINVPTEVAPPSWETTGHSTDEPDLRSPPPAPLEPNDIVPCPTCGEPIRYGANHCRHCGVIFDDASRHREMRPFPPGEVISEAYRIFSRRWPLMIGACLTMGILPIIPMTFGLGMINLGVEILDQRFAGSLSIATAMICSGLVISLTTLLWAFYLQAGFCVLTLKVVREQPARFRDLFSGGHYWGRFGVNLILYMLIIQLGLAACFIPGILLAVMFMPFAYALVDDDLPGIDCLFRALKLTEGNLGSLFLILLFAFGCWFAGFLFCFVGSLVAIPYIYVLTALAYERMTFQTPLNQ